MLTPSVVDLIVLIFQTATFASAALVLMAWYLQSHYIRKAIDLMKSSLADDSLEDVGSQLELRRLLNMEAHWTREAVFGLISTVVFALVWQGLVLFRVNFL
jgi:hypothetical protein